MNNDRYKSARIICVLAALFYIIVSIPAFYFGSKKEAMESFDELFGDYNGQPLTTNEDIDLLETRGTTKALNDVTVEYSSKKDKEEPEESGKEGTAPEKIIEDVKETGDNLEKVLDEAGENAESEASGAENEASPAESEDGREYYSFTAITGDSRNLNMRKDPNIISKVVYTIPRGETGYILEAGDDWSRVYYDGVEGYCSNEYLNLKEISREEFEEGIGS